MEFSRRNINKTKRNGDVYISSSLISYSSSSSYGSSSSGGGTSGNYLPATLDSANTSTYIVPYYVTFQESGTTTDDSGNTITTTKNLLEITSTGIKVNGNVIATGEVTAYGSGSSTSSSGSTSTGSVTIYDGLDSTQTDVALSANQGRVLKELIDTIDVSNVDVDLSDYYTKSQTDTLLAAKSNSSHTHSEYATTANLNSHSSNTTSHITATERTNWNAAYNNNHSHSNKTVLDGISSTNVSNWNEVYNDWNDVFEINSDGSLKCKVSLYGEGEISAFGSGVTEDNINLENYYTKDEIDGMLESGVGGSDVDLTGYYTKTQTDTLLAAKSNTAHTHSNATTSASGLMSATDKSKLDGITTSADSVSFSRSLTSGTKIGTITINGTGTDLYCETNTNTTYSVVGANGTTGLIKNGSTVTSASGYIACPIVGGIPYYKDTNTTYSLSSFGITATAAELNYCDGVTSNIQTQLNGKAATHSHPYASSSHTHNYAGSSSAGGAATSANKVNSTLTFTGYQSKTFNGSAAVSVAIPNNTNQLTNGAGFITSSASITGNAGSATKLATARTLWGQSFNGTANVSGNMTGVGSITASGAISCASLTASGEVTAYSDKRLKSNIKPLKNRGYITPVTYTKDDKESIGFIAQDVQKLYPELVTVDESSDEKYLSVNYMQYAAVLQAQIIELQAQIDSLWKIIKEKDIY